MPPRLRCRVLATEVVQTSGIDCGPAALKCLLDGVGVEVSYGRLREACRTDVDGTSIDRLEEICRELDIEAEQIMIPADHVLLSEAKALPAIAVVRNPDGSAHFVVAWRRHGPVVQVMDPASGRIWMPAKAFLRRLVVHSITVPAAEWRQWAGSDDFLRPLGRRLKRLGLTSREREALIGAATSDPGWRALGTLDAGTRMVEFLRSVRALKLRDARVALAAILDDEQARSTAGNVPDQYWSVREVGFEQLRLRGAVLVRVPQRIQIASSRQEVTERAEHLSLRSPELAAAITERPARPLRDVIRALREDGILSLAVAGLATAIVTVGVVFEAVLLRSVLDIATFLRLPQETWWAGAVLIAFAAALLGLEVVLAAAERRAGSHLETRLRIAFLDKIPRLSDAYFHSRPVSDMIERSHSLHTLRQLPPLGFRCVRVALELLVTTCAIVWLNPAAAALAIAGAFAAAAIPLVANSVIAERDLRVRTHAGALARFHLDALLGRTAIEAHGAGSTLEREHESLLTEWAGSSMALQRAAVGVEGLQMLVGFGIAGWMLFNHLAGDRTAGMLLLQTYWMLNIPALGYELALFAREYPAHRSTVLRLLEPLGAPEGQPCQTGSVPLTLGESTGSAGVRIEARGVHVRASGHPILENVDLQIAAGSHVAIVGASGAGKSTLVGLLLGWHRPAAGDLLIDGRALTDQIEDLRRVTAWVDPTVHLWNRPLLDNLLYGSDGTQPLGPVLEAAHLLPTIARLPDGLATPLGEGGALLSAGEAQRVRLARAMLKQPVRLAILDEPFLGLERDRRKALMVQARSHWAGSTLLYVTHDVTETRLFDRVIVVERGRIAEDGDPKVLAQTSTRYRWLLQSQERIHSQFAGPLWRHVRLESGQIVHEQEHVAAIEQTA